MAKRGNVTKRDVKQFAGLTNAQLALRSGLSGFLFATFFTVLGWHSLQARFSSVIDIILYFLIDGLFFGLLQYGFLLFARKQAQKQLNR